jgi:hypothetical protein
MDVLGRDESPWDDHRLRSPEAREVYAGLECTPLRLDTHGA